MNYQDWNKNPTLAASLREDLRAPHWIAAISVLESLGYGRSLADVPAHIITAHGVALAAKVGGYEKAIKNLKLLANPEESQPVQPPEETYGASREHPTD